jgi:hypothetical protein
MTVPAKDRDSGISLKDNGLRHSALGDQELPHRTSSLQKRTTRSHRRIALRLRVDPKRREGDVEVELRSGSGWVPVTLVVAELISEAFRGCSVNPRTTSKLLVLVRSLLRA